MKQEDLILREIMAERILQNIASQDMAEYLDIDKRTYYNIENGKTSLSMDKFLKICERLKKSPSHFMDSGSRNIIEPNGCIILTTNDYGTLYFSASDEQMEKLKQTK